MKSSETSEFDRIDFKKLVPGAYRAMLALETHVHQSGLEPALLELVKMRASQINGCAYCLDMHSKDARRTAGEPHDGDHRDQQMESFRSEFSRRGRLVPAGWLTNQRRLHRAQQQLTQLPQPEDGAGDGGADQPVDE